MKFKKLPKKTVVLLSVSAALVLYSLYDYVTTPSQSKPAVTRSNVEDDLLAKVGNQDNPEKTATNETPQTKAVEPEIVEPEFRPLPPSYYGAELKPKKPQKVTVEKPMFHLSKEGEAVLEHLASKYANDVRIELINSQISLKEAQDKLTTLKAPKVAQMEEKKAEKPPQVVPLKNRIVISSIITSSKSKRAWVNLDGEDLPIAEGAALYGLKVLSISSNSVIFEDLSSKERFQKFFNHQIVTESVNNE